MNALIDCLVIIIFAMMERFIKQVKHVNVKLRIQILLIDDYAK